MVPWGDLVRDKSFVRLKVKVDVGKGRKGCRNLRESNAVLFEVSQFAKPRTTTTTTVIQEKLAQYFSTTPGRFR